MDIVTKTQLQQDLEKIQLDAVQSEEAIENAISKLNDTHRNFWNLPDDRLESVLQHMVDENLLDSVFMAHLNSATDLNKLATDLDLSKRAIVGPAREFTVTDGIVTLTPIPVTILDSEPEPTE